MEEPLYRQLIEEDGTRHYIGNSREINLRQSGDWHYIEDPSLYFTKYAEGFSTEIGTFSAQLASTIRKIIKPEDQWPINDAWHYHDLHSNNQNLPGYLKADDSLYGKPTGLGDFSRKVQLVNYESHRAIFEGWNNRMWDRGSGVLLWMTHPAWPSMIWQTYTWDGETHGSYYGAKKACEPVHVQLNRHDGRIVIANATLRSMQGLSLEYSILGADGGRVFSKVLDGLSVPADEKAGMDAPGHGSLALPSTYLVRLRLSDASGKAISVNEYWRAAAGNKAFQVFNEWGDQPLSVLRLSSSTAGRMSFQVRNSGKAPVVGIRLNLSDAGGQVILPAFFSDGYFTLMPGESRELSVEVPGNAKGLRVVTEGYNSPTKAHGL